MDDAKDEQGRATGWRIDRRIPVWGLAIGVGQGVVWGVIMYSTLYTSQMNLDKRITLLEQTSITSEKFGRLDEKMNGVQQALIDVKGDIGVMKADVQRLAVRGRP